MGERRQKVTDDGTLHRYRTEIPNTIIRGMLGRGLSLPARWLYVYLKSVAGDSGECWQNMTTLTTGAQISRGAVSNARRELVEAKLIVVIKGKGSLHETDRIRILDIWQQNMAEFCGIASSSCEPEPSSSGEPEGCQPYEVVTSEDDIRVHDMNSASSSGERASSSGELKKISLKKETTDSLTTFESSSGEQATLPTPDQQTPDHSSIPKKKVARKSTKQRQPIVIEPISRDHWLWELLEEYRNDFDVEALDDWEWWSRFAKTFDEGVFTKKFVSAAFADLAQWFVREPQRKPQSKRYWLERIHFSLNRFYNTIYSRRLHGHMQQGGGSPQQTAIANFVKGTVHD